MYHLLYINYNIFAQKFNKIAQMCWHIAQMMYNIFRLQQYCTKKKGKWDTTQLNKTQIKKKVGELLEKLEVIKSELEDLQMDVDVESVNIEPYEDKDELTQKQQERQDWLDNVSYALGELIDNMDTSELEGYMEE